MRHEEAVRAYRHALEAAPDLALLHRNLAAALEALGRPEEASGHERRAEALEKGAGRPAPG